MIDVNDDFFQCLIAPSVKIRSNAFAGLIGPTYLAVVVKDVYKRQIKHRLLVFKFRESKF